MNARLSPWGVRSPVLFLCLILLIATPVLAQQQAAAAPEPAVYLNFDEGSGTSALDSSGHGNAATLHNASRIESGGCSRALSFANPDSYVAIPYRVLNHPTRAITVSCWFYVDNITPAPLISSHYNGGYRLGFDDGNELWWTVNLEGTGDISVPVQHVNIAPGLWHHVTGTYDGSTTRVYLDGVLRNQANATGTIHYEGENYILLGAEAGAADTPAECPRYFTGGIDEVRIYPVALSYSQVMDDRFRCLEGVRASPGIPLPESVPGTCEPVSGSIRLGNNETAARVLSFANKTINGTWQVSVQPGSLLSVQADDFYMNAYPDAWYLEIADDRGKPARTIAFPNRNNAPAEAVLPSGNATVTVRYFSGGEQFPAQVLLSMKSLPPVHPPQAEHKNILENPIIVIYTASWATLVAILLVIIWLNRRKKARLNGENEQNCPCGEDKKL